jgi:hypothetical protein
MAIWSPRTAAAAVVVALTLVVALAAPAGAAAKTCGSFTHTYRYTVSATGGLKCPSAPRLVVLDEALERRHLLHEPQLQGLALRRGLRRRQLLAREALRQLPEPLKPAQSNPPWQSQPAQNV